MNSYPTLHGVCTFCGDSIVQTPIETCDQEDDSWCDNCNCLNGYPVIDSACGYCGDGTVTPHLELCDPLADNLCSHNCKSCLNSRAPVNGKCSVCGDNIISRGEECDGLTSIFPLYCTKDCKLTDLGLKFCQRDQICSRPYCGDGQL